MAQTPRCSKRLAAQPLNMAIRASKKGEVLAMKKLGIITHDHEAGQVTDKEFDKFLVTTMQPCHFAALRDIFSTANNLTDEELLQITSQAGSGMQHRLNAHGSLTYGCKVSWIRTTITC